MSEKGLTEALEAMERITDYFDQRADAEAVGDPARYQGNREMHLRRDVETVAAALAAARAEGAAEAFERAMKECETVMSTAGHINDAHAYQAAKIIRAEIRALAAKGGAE